MLFFIVAAVVIFAYKSNIILISFIFLHIISLLRFEDYLFRWTNSHLIIDLKESPYGSVANS